MNISQDHYKKTVGALFIWLKTSQFYSSMMRLPFVVRLLLGIFLLFIGIIVFISPFPGGTVLLLSAALLVFGQNLVQKYTKKLFFILGIHIVMGKFQRWRGDRKG